MALRILLVNNSSAAPYRLVRPDFDASIEDVAPAVAWRIAAAGGADASLIPVAMIACTTDTMEIAGDYGVACNGAVGSVLLLSRIPLDQLLAGEGCVRLSSESETSRRLIQVLFRRESGRELRIAGSGEVAEAELVIGDVALRRKQDRANWPNQYDLCEWWRRSTGLSFVFARWVVRRDVSADSKASIRRWLELCARESALERGRARMSEIALGSGLFPALRDADRYFAGLRCVLGSDELEGERAFLDEMSEFV